MLLLALTSLLISTLSILDQRSTTKTSLEAFQPIRFGHQHNESRTMSSNPDPQAPSHSHDHTHEHSHSHGPPNDDWKNSGVRVIPSDSLDTNTAQTPGMDRAAAINFARVGAQKLWAGTVNIHANAKTGAHHHGHLESVIYVLKGKARMRWGEKLEFTAGELIPEMSARYGVGLLML